MAISAQSMCQGALFELLSVEEGMAEDWPGEGQLHYSLNGSLAKPDRSREAEMTSELTQRCESAGPL